MFDIVLAGIDGRSGGADAMALAELLAAPGAQVIPTRIQPGRPVGRGLHEAAVEAGADLIVVGSSRRGALGRILAGDDVRDTLRHAPRAVAVAPHGFAAEPRPIQRIGVGYDASSQAQAALDAAKAMAAGGGIEVRALGVTPPPQALVMPIGISAAEAVEARRERTRDRVAQLTPGVVAHAVDGIAHQRLAELSAEVDLLVVGSSRRGAVGRVVLGSTSEALSHEAACPLLVVTAPESNRRAPAPPTPPASAPAG